MRRPLRWHRLPSRRISSKMVNVGAVVAVTPSYGIGQSGTLPWVAAGTFLPSDLKYFRQITAATADPNKMNVALMGRRTWLGIPEKNRPLKNRLNMVITSNEEFIKSLPEGVMVAKSLDNAIDIVTNSSQLIEKIESVIIVGGVRLFEEALLHPKCTSYHVTELDTEFPCDTYLTQTNIDKLKSLKPKSMSESITENGVTFRMKIFSNC